MWPFRDRWILADADERHRASPDTFEVPSPEEKAAVRSGDLVKLIFVPRRGTVERMWTLVERIEGDTLVGRLDNEPLGIRGLEVGAVVSFERRHVCQIWSP